ncbi:MAG: hypothetical protein ABI789_01475 [Usitatibacter sp.]
MEKITLTPGKLYARLSEEFARRRPRECASCQMPMVYVIERRDGDCANWMIGDLAVGCEHCRVLVNDIVSTLSFKFDIFDPTCTPVPEYAPPARLSMDTRLHF